MIQDNLRVSEWISRTLLRRSEGFVSDSNGASAAEFSIILLPCVIILVVIMQFGMLLYVHNDMFNAARSSARALALSELATVSSFGAPTACGAQAQGSIEDVACDHLANWQGMTNFSVEVNVTAADGCDQVEVVVTTPMEDATLFNMFGVLSGRTLTANMVIRSQHDIVATGGSDPIADAGSGNCNIDPET